MSGISRGTWTITSSLGTYRVVPVVTISGLEVTPAQAQAYYDRYSMDRPMSIRDYRAGTRLVINDMRITIEEAKYVRTPAPPDWGLCVIDGLEITEAEAMRIRDHEDPRQVLLDGSGKYRLTAVLWKPA